MASSKLGGFIVLRLSEHGRERSSFHRFPGPCLYACRCEFCIILQQSKGWESGSSLGWREGQEGAEDGKPASMCLCVTATFFVHMSPYLFASKHFLFLCLFASIPYPERYLFDLISLFLDSERQALRFFVIGVGFFFFPRKRLIELIT